MAEFTITGVDPSLSVLGMPTELKTVSGTGDALAIVRKMQAAGTQQIKIIQHNGSEITIPDLERLAGGG